MLLIEAVNRATVKVRPAPAHRDNPAACSIALTTSIMWESAVPGKQRSSPSGMHGSLGLAHKTFYLSGVGLKPRMVWRLQGQGMI